MPIPHTTSDKRPGRHSRQALGAFAIPVAMHIGQVHYTGAGRRRLGEPAPVAARHPYAATDTSDAALAWRARLPLAERVEAVRPAVAGLDLGALAARIDATAGVQR
ncbi:hypothetical protein ACFQNE_01910 [Gordonia phosphorivorans]|uniref:Uncharacterized protein n=1 Tax=Gordonia phosphorivorans TaxID=1056982 RepID=A0ABV6H8F6_9ACTN